MRMIAYLFAVVSCLSTYTMAENSIKSHGISSFGDLKYPADFEHFDYVNPDAPKGGQFSSIGTSAITTFDSFNGYILKGDAAQGTEFLFDSLMIRATDEPDAMYGLIAKSAEMPDDRQWVIFNLRPEAKFSDGSQLTAHDVKFSLEIIREKGHPLYGLPLKDITSIDVENDARIKITFREDAPTRGLPLTIASMPIFSMAYYQTQPFDESTLEKPLGSGPYVIGDYEQGRYVTYERRKDYWAKDLPVMQGQYNFDKITYKYYRDRDSGFAAFKGGEYNFREEFTSKTWSTEYDFPAVQNGKVIKSFIHDGRPTGAQGFWINTRKDKFKDPRVREAIGMGFDFEWSNERLFYGLYTRTNSFFVNTSMQADGLPSKAELDLLKPFEDNLPKTVFELPYDPPITDGSGKNRKNIRKAGKLLDEAGWKVVNGKRTKDGEVLSVEFLDDGPSFERIVNPFIKNLERLGIEATFRTVDRAQFQRRFEDFDFDIVSSRLPVQPTPGPELYNLYSRKSAETKGSYNLSGFTHPAIDAMIEKINAAQSREELNIAAKALDRILRAYHIWAPHWYKATHSIAYQDIFGQPDNKAPFDRSVIRTWWIDGEKEAQMKAKSE